MSIWVKLCGMRSKGDVEAAVEAGADAVGVVMTQAMRQVNVSDAVGFVEAAAGSVTTVGVFYRPRRDFVEYVRDMVPFDLFQAEPESVSGIEGIERLPVVHDRPDLEQAVERAFPAADQGMVLVESAGRGGKGHSPDWSRVAGLARIREIVVAGGLDPATVAGVIKDLWPRGVDVSSGVESSPGVKDHRLMRNFVEAARQAAATEVTR
ncbi:MAG: N-(5'-phosphoribosyl)anthranilate isomerase [Actinobacteria bacterium]|nr:MAG: N-(5'-phosphoribosyl)anthranilate isomerase [Actinomycetota bacterium]